MLVLEKGLGQVMDAEYQVFHIHDQTKHISDVRSKLLGNARLCDQFRTLFTEYL